MTDENPTLVGLLEYTSKKYHADPSNIHAGLYRRTATRAWFAKEISDQALLRIFHLIRDRENSDER